MAKQFNLEEYLKTFKLLTDEDRQCLLEVTACAPTSLPEDVGCQHCYTGPKWKSHMSWFGVEQWQQKPVPPEVVYRVRGTGHVDANVEEVHAMVVNTHMHTHWDPLVKHVEYLSKEMDPSGRVMVGYVHYICGVPAFVSAFFNNREFISRWVSVRLPSGTCIMSAHSIDTSNPPLNLVVPATPPRTVRAHLGNSGWIFEAVGESSTTMTMLLQVDPKGSVPKAVANYATCTTPLNINRIGKAIRNLDPETMDQLLSRSPGTTAAARKGAHMRRKEGHADKDNEGVKKTEGDESWQYQNNFC